MLMRWRFLLMLVFMLSSLANAEVLVRAELSASEFWIGQRVILKIEVLGDQGWSTVSRMGAIDVQGAYILQKESQGTRLNETIDGKSYSGQSYELSVFPQVEGEIVIPPVSLEVVTRTWGEDSSEKITRIKTPVASFVSKIPPGAEDIAGLVTTSNFKATQSWKPDTQDFSVGDALERSIILQADDISGMAFTPLMHKELAGVGIYPSEPEVEDTINRGVMKGKRTESVTYVFEHVGKVEIPDIVLNWWDFNNNELKQITLGGRRFEIVAGAESAAETIVSLKSRNPTVFWPVVLGCIFVAFLVLHFRHHIRTGVKAWHFERRNSEVTYFKRVKRSLRARKPDAVLRDTMRWLDRIGNTSEIARFDVFCDRYGNAHLHQQFEALSQGTYAGQSVDWSALADGLTSARTQWQQAQQRTQRIASSLPDLNYVANR